MPLLEEISKSGLCTGCGLCQAIAPPGAVTMEMSTLGYLRPKVNTLIAKDTEQAINRVCPGVIVEHESIGDNYHPNWGPITSVHVGYANDTEIRRLGSSGGVISALCNYLIQTKQVDFIAQIGADGANPIANKLHLSRTREEVVKAAGSRYAPTAPLASLNELLATGERFAFVGKPCDAAALRAYLRYNPQHEAQVPYIISFMCAGIPSQQATVDVINAMGANPSEVATFRYRGDGWPGMARAIQTDGQAFEMDYNSSWGNILGKQLQYRCKICADGIGEFADIVCADAWYGKDGYPDFAEREGRSLILARTQKGAQLITSAVTDQAISMQPLAVEEIALMQPYQLNRKRLAAARSIATRLALGRTTKFKRLKLGKIAFDAGFLTTLRNAWGTYKRAKGE